MAEPNASGELRQNGGGDAPDLPRTRAMLMRACDVRLPARLTLAEGDVIADVLRDAAQTAARQKAA